ncbi:DnaA ATPase domain-containing protein [Flaviaesturariibacter amylovorans]|uniref:DnaA ATPase domain-containing protein n=1 Tax=Flaviaesturariibacter amylovorans TaxID=1084520 RepID=UPI0031ED8E26
MPDDVGFVTPVFSDGSGSFFIQVGSRCRQFIEWQTLDEGYSTLVKKYGASPSEHSVDSPIYGFKNEEKIIYLNGREMDAFLKQELDNGKVHISQLAQAFFDKWEKLELPKQPSSKEEVWDLSLQIVSHDSERLAQIFRNQLVPISFDGKTLRIQSNNKPAKQLFEQKFQLKIETELKESDIHIVFEEQYESGLTLPPFVYYGGHDAIYTAGSFILQTAINPHQDFDNFVVGDFNEKAFLRAQELFSLKPSNFAVVQGAWGVGKTHFINAIANRCKAATDNVGFYRIVDPSGTGKLDNEAIDTFYRSAEHQKIVIVDDIHWVSKEKNFARLVEILKAWSDQGKNIIISQRNDLAMPLVAEQIRHADTLTLNPPKEADKSRLIRAKVQDYEIPLTETAIARLSQNAEISSVADVELYLSRALVLNQLGTQFSDFNSLRKLFERKYKSPDSLPFSSSIDIDHIRPSKLGDDIFYHFAFGLFKEKSNYSSEPFINSQNNIFQYSLTHLQKMLFENKSFKDTVISIIRNAIIHNL